ncbi:MAG: Gfo/Idh/MocA family oxidoreductase [Fidelibacterota bacterium]
MKAAADIVWGVIGAGRVCEKKSMPAMQIIPHSRVKTVMRRNAAKCRDFAARHNVPVWTTRAEEIFRDPEINAVYVATPPDTHALYTGMAAKAGKAVYVEKPMARNYAECKRMIRDCERAGVPLFVAYYRRALPHFLRVGELLKEKRIGIPCSVHIRYHRPPYPEDIFHPENNWRIQPGISGGGHFHDLASHQLDLMDFLFGPVVRAHGIAENRAGLYVPADTLTGVFRFKNGVAGGGDWCFVSPPSEERDLICILGTEGILRFSTFANACIYGDFQSTGIIKEEMELPLHIQEPLIRSIVSELRGEGSCPSTGESAARTSRVMDLLCSGK